MENFNKNIIEYCEIDNKIRSKSDEIKDMLIKAGFSKIEIVNLPEDVASIHIGRKV